MAASSNERLRWFVVRDRKMIRDELVPKKDPNNPNLRQMWVEYTLRNTNPNDDGKRSYLLGTFENPDYIIERNDSEGWGRYVVGEKSDIERYEAGDIDIPLPEDDDKYSESSIRQALIKANGDPVQASRLIMASAKLTIGTVLDRMSWKSVQKYLGDGKGGIMNTTIDVPFMGTYVAIKFQKREDEDWVDVWTWDLGFTKLPGIPWHIQYDLDGNEIKREYNNMPN